jgi:hypothetical protein
MKHLNNTSVSKLKGRDPSEDLDFDGRIIPKLIFKK